MSENQRGIKQVGPFSFLFFNDEEIFFFLSFEIVEILKIKIDLIKMMKTETYVFENIIHFNQFGTEDISPEDTLNTVSYLVNSNNFTIKEDDNKITLSINSKNPASIELLIYDKKDDSNKELSHNAHINNVQNRIQELLNTISKQNQKINELKQREQIHKNLINKIGEITNNISQKLDNENNKSNQNNNQNYQNNTYNNPYNPYNPYNTNNNNYSFDDNLSYGRARTMTCPNGKNPIIQTKVNVVYQPILPNNNVNNLLVRPENRAPLPVQKVEKTRTINLDNIENYRP